MTPGSEWRHIKRTNVSSIDENSHETLEMEWMTCFQWSRNPTPKPQSNNEKRLPQKMWYFLNEKFEQSAEGVSRENLVADLREKNHKKQSQCGIHNIGIF